MEQNAGVVEVVEDASPSMDETEDEDEDSTQVSMGNYDDEVFDDVWVHIFRWLPLKQRIQLERVSRKWKRLMPYSDITSVELTDFLRRQDPKDLPMVRQEHVRQVLMGVLSRCGRDLRHLTQRKSYSLGFGLNKDLADLLVGKAPKLVTLDLTHSVLSLAALPILTRLNQLEDLCLREVTVTDEEFVSKMEDKEAIKTALSSLIQNLPALKTLHLSSLSAPTCPTPSIHSASLKELTISGMTLTTANVQDFARCCPNLEHLELSCIRGPSNLQLGALAALHNLQKLRLDGGTLRSEDLAGIFKNCPKLEWLDLSGHFELSSCAELWRLAHLKHLSISPSGCIAHRVVPVDDAVLASVAKYEQLQYVSLPRAKISDEGLGVLARCPNLVSLGIPRIKTITDIGLKAVLAGCQRLQDLDVGLTSIGDETMAAVGVSGVRLATVDVCQTLVTDEGLRRLVEEREKRAVEGEDLVELEVSVSCLDADKDVDSARLKMISDEGCSEDKIFVFLH